MVRLLVPVCVTGSERCFTKDSGKKADVFVYVEDDLGHTVSLLNLTTQTSDMVSLSLNLIQSGLGALRRIFFLQKSEITREVGGWFQGPRL